LIVPVSAEIRNQQMVQNIHRYFRTRSRDSENYEELVNGEDGIEREPDVIYPDRWYDWDIDRVIVGQYCVHFGVQELKHMNNLREPFTLNPRSRQYIKRQLNADNFKIETTTKHFTVKGQKGVISHELDVVPISTNYKDYLKAYSEVQLSSPATAGKGVFLFLFYSDNFEYFIPINFTGSELLFGKQIIFTRDGYREPHGVNNGEYHRRLPYGRLDKYLDCVGQLVEPCFDELLLFLVEAYIRRDFKTLFKYMQVGVRDDLIRFEDDQEVLINSIKEAIRGRREQRKRKICMWDAYCFAMEWVLNCIHIDTMLMKRHRYLRFVELTQSLDIYPHLAKMINWRYQRNMRTYRE